MAGREQADGLLAQFGAVVGIDGLRLSPDGTAILRLGDDLFIFIGVDPAGETISLAAPIPDSAGRKPAALLEELLSANFMWRGTDGATLAVDGPLGPVTLLLQLPLTGLAYPAFEAALRRFGEQASLWQARCALAGIAAERGGQPGAADLTPSDFFTLRA